MLTKRCHGYRNFERHSIHRYIMICLDIGKEGKYISWTNLSYQDKTWDEFSSLDSAVFVLAMNCIHFVKQPNLILKTWYKQLLGFLPLVFELPDIYIYYNHAC
jgi:hypothetical protein